MSESWTKEWCPKCHKSNWLCGGDPEDCNSRFDYDVLECCHCDHQWLIYPEEYEYTGKGEPWIVRGRKNPDDKEEEPKKKWSEK